MEYAALLETERLLLKAVTPAMVSRIFEQLPKERIMQLLGHGTEEAYRLEEYKYRNGYVSYNRQFLMFLLEDKTTRSIIGRCSIHNWNAAYQRAEIGYDMTDETFQRKGLMTEAVVAVVAYAFDTLQLNRLEAIVAVMNTASLKLIQRLGFEPEGVLRQYFTTAERREDALMFAQLKEEYNRKKSSDSL